MRIEQRIGRVDRIGQKRPVKAFNLIFEDSVELRVQEVLEEKLATILDEFGVDKTQDVLDSAERSRVRAAVRSGDPQPRRHREEHRPADPGSARAVRMKSPDGHTTARRCWTRPWPSS